MAEVKDMLRKLNIPFTEEKLESDENKIYDAISKLISYIPDWKKSLIVIDGIDQLSDLRETIFLNYLPKIKILVSCRDGTDAMEHMKSFSYKTIILSQLDMEKIKEIIKSVLKEMGKELTEDQINRISSSKASSNPLYLRTLIDQLCKIGELKKNTETQTDFMNRMIEKHLKPNLEDLYGLMIENLKDILKKYFDDEDVVIQFLKLIAISRSGLSQQEIVSMSNIKPAEFAVIRNYLDYHLAEKNGLIDFFHASLKEVVFKKYINNNLEKETRRIISNWFLDQKTDKRQIYELPYQLFALGDKSTLKEYVKKFEVFKLFTEVLDSTEYFEFIMYLKSSFGNLCKEVVEAYQPQILSLSEDESSLYFNSLGLVCLNTGCYNEATDSFNKSLQTDRKYYGDEHPDISNDLSNLGVVYEKQGRYDEAEKMLKKALEIDRKYYGNENPSIATNLSNLGILYRKQGRYDEAEKMLKEALEIYKKYYGDEHPDISNDLSNLGVVYQDQGRYDEAEKMLKEALEIYKKYYGDEHPIIARDLSNLGSLYQKQGRYDKAEKMYNQSLEILRKYYGDEHPSIATNLINLGFLYYDQERYDKAEKMFNQALEILRKYYGNEHPIIARDLSNLGILYGILGRYDKAEKMFNQALEILRKYTRGGAA
ncbi:MAG: tetratricopeptide repeat protein [Candidatus Micrarchaeia archaeon]